MKYSDVKIDMIVSTMGRKFNSIVMKKSNGWVNIKSVVLPGIVDYIRSRRAKDLQEVE